MKKMSLPPSLRIGETRSVRRKARPTVLVGGLQLEALRHAILDAAHEFDWDLLDLAFTGDTIPTDPVPKGALIVSANPALHRQLLGIGCCLVELVPSFPPWPSSWPVVATDMVAQGRLAAEHFSERGFRQVAFVGCDPWSDARPVYDSFHDRAAELGLSCGLLQLKSPAKDERLSPDVLFKRRERQMTAWLRSLPKPVGVLTYSDRRAAIICATAKHAGLAVPEEIAILGRGNDPYTCEVAPVMLSSIEFDHTGMGWQAARLLQRLMQGEAPPEAPILIPPKGIVERQSTDVLATPDPHVAAALRYMWDHLDLDVSVDDVARAVSVPRHRLERAFRQHLDCGINEELRRKRLEVFRERLTATDKPISELAPSVGFRTMVHLQRSFRRAYGMSPRQWRAHALNLAERG